MELFPNPNVMQIYFEGWTMRSLVLLLFGIPLPIIIVLWLLIGHA
jgi:hypothetical protein